VGFIEIALRNERKRDTHYLRGRRPKLWASYRPLRTKRDVYYQVGRRPKKIVKPIEKLREAKATTLRRVQLARSCAMGGEDVVGEVKGVDSRAGGVGGRTIATICS